MILNVKVEWYNARVMEKGFIQKEGIDIKEIYSLISLKNSFRIVMAFVAHFDLELHQDECENSLP